MAKDTIFIQIGDERMEAPSDIAAQIEKDRAQNLANELSKKEQLAAAEAAKVSAIAKLTALGLTEQEAKAVIGIV